MLTDAVVGMLGGSLLRPGITAIRRGWRVARHYVDDAARLSSTYLDDLIAWGWVFSPFARPTVATGIGYAAVDHVYDTYFSESSASSSSSYQQNGGAGGTGKPVTVEPTYERRMTGPTQSYTARICPPGYTSRKVRGKWICVLKGHRTPGWS